MQEKQKVTLYLPADLHRQLKIQAAVCDEPMSALAEKAIGFYLTHPEVVEQMDLCGRTHQVHHCPACQTAVVIRDGDLVGIGAQPTVLPAITEDLLIGQACDAGADKVQEALIPC
jgi:hypothetical protein